MSFSLGQAKLILDVNAQPLIEAEAVAWKATRQGAQAVTAFLANENNVRVGDVKKAASLILAENARAAKEQLAAEKAAVKERIATAKVYFDYNKRLLKEELAEQAKAEKAKLAEEKRVAAERKATTKAILDYNKRVYAEEVAEAKRVAAERKKAIVDNIKNEVAELKKAEQYRKERARAIIAEEKRIEAERLAAVKKAFAEEAALRRKREQEEKAEAARRAQNNAGGIGNTGLQLPSFKQAGAFAATLVGLGAIASGTLLLRETTLGLVNATLKQEEAQRALNAAFGKSAGIYKDLAAQYSKQFSLVNSEVEKSITAFGTLSKQSNLTSTEIQKLIPIAIDLQAAYGGSLEEAMRSTQAAILGETEALEKYRIVLQDGVLKTLPQLTEEEKKRFETMSESEKQLIRYRVLLDLAKESQGAAAKRAKDAQGGFNDFTNAVNKLALALGEDLVPAIGNAARGLAGYIDQLANGVKAQREFRKAQDELLAEREQKPSYLDAVASVLAGPFGSDLLPNRDAQQAEIQAQIARNRRREEIAKEVEENKRARQTAIEDAQKEQNRITEAANSAFRRRAEIAVEELKRAAEREVEFLEQRKKFEEAQERIQLTALENAHKANMDALEEQEYQRQRASEARLAQIQKDKDDEIRAIEERRDADIEAIRDAHEVYVKESNERIRQSEITRDALLRDIQIREDNDIRAIENAAEARKEARIIEDREIEDQLKRQDRAREDAHKKQLTRFEREGERLRDNYDDRIKEIEDQEEAEDDRHRKKIRNLEVEADTQEDINREAIAAIDAQLALLEAQEKAENNRRRIRDINRDIDEAQQELIRAQGRGTPEEITAARDKLVGAIRFGNPESIKKAQAELTELTGLGIEAVAEAQKKLSELQEDLIDENVDQTREAEKDKLKATKEALTEEAKLKKESLDREIKEEQRAEEDRNRRRKKRLNDDKEAEKERLDDALRKLELRKEAQQDAYEKDKQGADDAKENAKRALDDRRRAEDREHENNLTRIKNRADAERDAVKATYDDETTGIIPAIKRAQQAAKERHDADIEQVNERYKNERKQIYDTYDDPVNGLIARHRQAEIEAKRAYENAANAARDSYEKQRTQIQQTYRNDDGVSGILDRLDAQKKKTEEALRDDLLEWEKWKDGLAGPDGVVDRAFKDAKALFDKFLQDLQNRGGLVQGPRIVVDVVTPSPSRSNIPGPDPATPGERNTGIPGGDQDVPSIYGGGTGSVEMPSGVGNTGTQVGQADPPSFDPDDYRVTFGWKQQYSGGYPAAPGWAPGNTAAWTNGPSHHKGIDLSGPQGIGSPIVAFTPGKVVSTHAFSGNPDKDPGGNYIVIEGAGGRTHWYLHLDKMTPPADGIVKRGTLIGTQGWSGLDKPSHTHLHYEVRNGFNNGPQSLAELERDGIDPRPYIQGNARDSGYLFRHPTVYRDLVTGERGIMAEKRPERLLGGEATKRFDSGSLSPTINRITDYATIGSNMSGFTSVQQNSSGDTMIYNGVATENVIQRWRSDQKKRSLLRGVGGLIRNG